MSAKPTTILYMDRTEVKAAMKETAKKIKWIIPENQRPVVTQKKVRQG